MHIGGRASWQYSVGNASHRGAASHEDHCISFLRVMQWANYKLMIASCRGCAGRAFESTLKSPFLRRTPRQPISTSATSRYSQLLIFQTPSCLMQAKAQLLASASMHGLVAAAAAAASMSAPLAPSIATQATGRRETISPPHRRALVGSPPEPVLHSFGLDCSLTR